jgi:hypothetical protein
MSSDMVNSRLKRESKTVAAMISLYCRDIHHNSGLCQECTELKEYALQRLVKCPFQASKPACSKCPVHCYQPSMREKIRQVMRYAGPRMIFHHPVMAFFHIIDGKRKAPDRVQDIP